MDGLLLAYDEVNYPQHSPTQQPQPSTLPDPDRLQRERSQFSMCVAHSISCRQLARVDPSEKRDCVAAVPETPPPPNQFPPPQIVRPTYV
ncbi:hypothetical protein F2P81_005877 [Scophthalmus maximus]|uniref:Uncharacterized protein n=1 Tax=Scophthalmus maximus TaxID=52904 RepID=A0A6A4TAW6_SCOMX|nr:hypothetical protein F2P81_005877 [Scophthalmus maximus]